MLAVCLGNICRSPAAEAAIRQAAEGAGLDIEVESAGTGDWHIGSPPHPMSRAAGSEVGLEIGGVARRVTPGELSSYDVVVAMDRSNYEDLRRMAPTSEVRDRIRLFRADGGDVPDPYYGTESDYRRMIEIVIPAARELVAELAREQSAGEPSAGEPSAGEPSAGEPPAGDRRQGPGRG